MKILIVGNSQVACLRIAHRLHPEIIAGIHNVNFYCFPGGWGPAFEVKDRRLAIIEGSTHKDYPPFADPADTPDRPIDDYGAIVVSALGNIGGGFIYPYDLMWRGTLHQFGPKENPLAERLVSKSCYREIVRSELETLPGIRFLRDLREAFPGRIIVQPFPRVSEVARDRPDWCLNVIYEDAVGAHTFFSEIRDEYLTDLSSELSLELLPYPEDGWRNDHFTPAEYIEQADGIHPNTRYGKLVLEQIVERLKPAPLPEATLREKERERISNLERYAAVDFIPLGEDSLSLSIPDQWGLARREDVGELPFDIEFHPLPKIARLINSDFENYVDSGDLRFSDDRNCWRNEALNLNFNCESGAVYAANDLELLRDDYGQRVANFRKRASAGGRIVFLLHLSRARPNAIFHVGNIVRALKAKFQAAETLLICINTGGTAGNPNDSDGKPLEMESVEFLHVPYPAENYIWHAPVYRGTPEGHAFEEKLVSGIKRIVDTWK